MSEPPQFAELLRRLAEAKIRFVVVGGFAVFGWGHIRATKDLDIVPEPTRENLERLNDVLVELEGKVKVGERLTSASDISTFLRAGDKTLVVTRLGEVDVLQGLPQIPRFEELAATAEPAEVLGVEVHVCSLDHLLQMKRAAGRTQDLADIEALEIAHGLDPGGEPD